MPTVRNIGSLLQSFGLSRRKRNYAVIVIELATRQTLLATVQTAGLVVVSVQALEKLG